MAEIRSDFSPTVDASEEALLKSEERAQQEVMHEIIQAIKTDLARAVDLRDVRVEALPASLQAELSRMLAEILAGQLPPRLLQALNEGTVDSALLNQLTQRLANSQDPNYRTATARNAQAAREAASDPALPQQALRWTRFVHRTQHLPGDGVQSRFGSASPKGEGTFLAEAKGLRAVGAFGPGFKFPVRVDGAELSAAQRSQLMESTFGRSLATQLEEIGILDPLMFVQAGSLPTGRAWLANSLGMSRARLLGLLMRAELLGLGPGRNGERGMRPDFLGPLRHAGIAMLGTIAAVRLLSQEELAYIFRALRKKAGGFKRAIANRAVPTKRDLIHWARTAGRRPSAILLADGDSSGQGFTMADAQELVQAWYLENLFWEHLAQARRERARREADADPSHDRGERDGQSSAEDQEEEPEWVADPLSPELEADLDREDRLMCFWITDEASIGMGPKMYVCVDPESGAIIPQTIG